MTDHLVTQLIGQLAEPQPGRALVERALRRPPPVGGRRVRYATVPSPIGPIMVAFHDAVVRSQVGADAVEFETSLLEEGWEGEPSEPPAALRSALSATIEGGERFAYPVDVSRLRSFQQTVLGCIRAIPRGDIRSYAWVARELGTPLAVRAVGTALARNPIPVLIPCHRVVRQDRRLGEYSGGGSSVKARLLRWEGVPIVSRGSTHWVQAATA